MRRVNVVFVAVVVGAALSGAVAAAGFGTELRAIDTISLVEDQVRTEVTDLQVVDDELRLTVRLSNPTGYPIGLEGTFVRVFQNGRTQVAYGAGQRVDDNAGHVPARGELTAEYVVGLTAEQAEAVRSAFEAGPVRLTVFHSLTLRGEPFEITRTNVTVTGTVGR